MNTVILLGRLTADIELRYMDNEDQTAYCGFTLAVNREFDREKADFIRCKVFGRTAEILEKYCGKGSQICIRGSWETGSYENKKGDTVYTNECRVELFDFAGSSAAVTEEAEKETRGSSRKGSERNGRNKR